jgi:50S ribosomal protein L16 3-hydroxylase
VPLRILTNFVPEEEFVVEAGDLLYLPPGYAHDGIAQGECMTYSIGFRIPKKAELARELLQRVADQAEDELGEVLYRDAGQPAVGQAAEIPAAMQVFAEKAVQDALKDPMALSRGLGEYMTEPKPNVWFESLEDESVSLAGCAVRLDRRTKMMFDEHHIFINGDSFLAAGRDADLMRMLANQRNLAVQEVQKLSKQAQKLLTAWIVAGWLQQTSC